MTHGENSACTVWHAGGCMHGGCKHDMDGPKSLIRCIHLQMLRSEDSGVHYEAVGVIGNLVHSSTEIKQKVLQVGRQN